MDKPDPGRALILASLGVNLTDVATLAMAEVLGRRCAGRDELIESARLFREYAEELGCAAGPRRFEAKGSDSEGSFRGRPFVGEAASGALLYRGSSSAEPAIEHD